MGRMLTSVPRYEEAYGVYTAADYNFFPGVVAAINSLRYHEYLGPIAVVDVGLHEWMRRYLVSYANVYVLDIEYLRQTIRYVDVLSNDDPVMHGWAFKAFAIAHFNLFESFSFIDADYLPLTNVENAVRPLVEAGEVVSTDDGFNIWTNAHHKAIGVPTGGCVNINAGFFSLSMRHHAMVLYEWRNVMTRRRPFDLWYGDQGALNAILDKYGIRKTTFDATLWNQTSQNESLKEADAVEFQLAPRPRLVHTLTGQDIKGWHGWWWHKPWHYLGIDEYRTDAAEREGFRQECIERVPSAPVDAFKHFLFLSAYNALLEQRGHLLSPVSS